MWSSTFHPHDKLKLKIISSLVRSSDTIVLDLGSGDGALSYQLLVERGFLIGIDVSANMLYKSMLTHRIIADLEVNIPIRRGVVDLCLACDIIEHLIDTDNFLDNIYRVLKPEGRVIISTPNLASLVERILLLLGYQPQNVEVSTIHKFGSFRTTPPAGHFRGFTLGALKEMLKYYRFRNIKVKTTSYYGDIPLLRVMDQVIGRIRKTLASLLVFSAVKG